MPDEGTVTWCNHITTGYLDQYSTLEKGKTIRDILKSAFNHMFELEQEMMGLYEKWEIVLLKRWMLLWKR